MINSTHTLSSFYWVKQKGKVWGPVRTSNCWDQPLPWLKPYTPCDHALGRLFSQRLATSKLQEFEDDFFTVLEKVQATRTLIDDDVDIQEVYGIGRLGRRGVTVHTINMEV